MQARMYKYTHILLHMHACVALPVRAHVIVNRNQYSGSVCVCVRTTGSARWNFTSGVNVCVRAIGRASCNLHC